MGSSISKIEEDYETYEYICSLKNITPEGYGTGTRSFFDHAREIMSELTDEEHAQYKDYYWYNRFKNIT